MGVLNIGGRGLLHRIPYTLKPKPKCAFAKVAVIGLTGLRLCARGHDVSGWLLSFWVGFRVQDLGFGV